MSLWEALAGRAPGRPVGPADPGLWAAVAERLNPARARPMLRGRIESAHLTSARDVDYVMLRSPDRTQACYLRLTPEEWQLAELMDGSRTVARLVAEFARISGKLAPDQVTRVVADLAGNRMLVELPLDAFRPLERVRRRPWPLRLGAAILAVIQGRRFVVANVDPLVGFLYRAGGRLLFTRPVAALCALVSIAGLAAFCWTWARGDQSVFLTGDSYALGAALLLGLNVFALACHELGHALAAKHAGRRVPMAGFLIYFGIPSVFVDTTDVWMAGRRARLRTTAAGPAAGLLLAGSAQLVALAYPAFAPFAFKLAFAWYVNAMFNLNPFMALDGYYLLMDAVEVPNLRARGLAWVTARLRRRPPRFKQLDGEGRLVAIYGMLAVVWLVIAANIAYRVYVDRVAGLALGLWRSGWVERLLFLAVVAGLCAPLVYLGVGWLRTRWRKARERRAEQRLVADEPRRLQALRDSPLGGLGPDELTDLAAASRWMHPKTGQQLIVAGGAQRSVYLVVEGALEGRRPGDPGGTVRERVHAGGIVGLAAALTAAPASLSWHTAGTTLLAIPSSVVARAVGPLPGPPPADQEEIAQLLDQLPAFATLTESERLGLSVYARPMDVPAGTPIELVRPSDALVVAAGVLQSGSGQELRRGAVIGPYGNEWPVQAGVTLTPTRAWWLPTMVRSAVPPPPAAPGPVEGGEAGPGRGPLFGVHPRAEYPPLAAPPGVPPSTVDDRADRRFERWLWLLLLFLGLLALTLTTTNIFPGPVWAEMPSDRALFTVTEGSAIATVGRTARRVGEGESSYLTGSGGVDVPADSTATLTFHGGGSALICGGSRVSLGALTTDSTTQPRRPSGEIVLVSGRVVVDTTGTSGAFAPLDLTVRSEDAVTGTHVTRNNGVARYAVTPDSSTAARGTVARDGAFLAPTGAALGCGPSTDTGPVTTAGTPGPTSTETAGPSPSSTPSPSASATPTPTPSPTASPTATPTRTTTRTPPRTTKPPTTGPPPTNLFPPTVDGLSPASFPGEWAPNNCGNANGVESIFGQLVVRDEGRTSIQDPESFATLTATVSWSIAGGESGSAKMTGTSVASQMFFIFDYTLGPFPPANGSTTATFTFTTTDGKSSDSRSQTVSFRGTCSD